MGNCRVRRDYASRARRAPDRAPRRAPPPRARERRCVGPPPGGDGIVRAHAQLARAPRDSPGGRARAARRGRGERAARSAHVARPSPRSARRRSARGARGDTARAGIRSGVRTVAALYVVARCGSGRSTDSCVQVCAPCLLRHPRIETDRAIWLVRPDLPNPDCMPVHYCRNRQGKLACSPLSSQS